MTRSNSARNFASLPACALLASLLLSGATLVGCGSSPSSSAAPDASSPPIEQWDAAAPQDCAGDETSCGSDCCSGQEVCLYQQVCVASGDTCSTNDDCQNDSYCDVNSGLCIPYDTVTPSESTDSTCTHLSVVGVFAPNVQCEWSGPPPGDPYPNHKNVLGTPMVVDFNFDDDPSTIRPSIVFVSYDGEDGGSGACVGSVSAFGVIRVIDGATCAQQANIDAQPVIASSPVAIGDLDGDSDLRPEIVAHRVGGGLAAFKWDAASSAFVTQWQTTSTIGRGQCLWSGPSIHDLNDDGIPEVLMGGAVFDGVTGSTIDESLGLLRYSQGQIPVVADLQGDGIVDLVTGSQSFSWDTANSKWVLEASSLGPNGFAAVADFGTFGSNPVNDDRATLDGIAEIAVVSSGTVRIVTLDGRTIFGPVDIRYFAPASSPGTGGPPTISDFDGDGRAEVSVAGRGGYNVLDMDCTGTPNAAFCNTLTTDGILWAKPTQDYSSSVTGSSVFDFEGDGRAEVVYADECFSRVYDGLSGEVLYSAYHTSCTWYENPIVADVDGDLNSEIVVPSNSNCGISCPALDPLFDGLRCETDADCAGTTTCALDSGAQVARCRCTSDADCGSGGYVCRDPVAGPSPVGQVCRAGHPNTPLQGVRVIRDTLDRWVNSRPIWNQHAYSVTNVSDSGKIPKTSQWLQNWLVNGLNNFRQNIIGNPALLGSPDLTSAGQLTTCSNGSAELSAKLCNRGTEAVASGAALSFYDTSTQPETVICTAVTSANLAPGACETLSCTWSSATDGIVKIVADDPGASGSQSNSECHEGNNLGSLELLGCEAVQ